MDDPIVVTAVDDQPSYASRGGHKLAGALAVFGPAGLVVTRPALPGRGRLAPVASPTSCSKPGPRAVVAVDVGHGRSTGGYDRTRGSR